MSVTPEQLKAVSEGLSQVDQTILKISRILQLITLEYKIDEQTKTLPETDKQALILQYKALKAQAIAQLNALP